MKKKKKTNICLEASSGTDWVSSFGRDYIHAHALLGVTGVCNSGAKVHNKVGPTSDHLSKNRANERVKVCVQVCVQIIYTCAGLK